MSAQLVTVGQPAHRRELQGIAFLVRGLPEGHIVYSNTWLAEPSGAIYELDAVVVAPQAVFVVEIKSYSGSIRGTDHDWLLPAAIRSPLKTNRLTAQKMHSELARRSRAAGRVWVEGFVFLSHTDDVVLEGEASRHRVHTKKTILNALRDPEYLPQHLTRFRPEPLDEHARAEIHRLLTGVDKNRRPSRRVREYELLGVQERADDFVEYRARHTMTGRPHVLRVYTIPWSASDDRRKRIEERATWEARVLVNVGRHRYIVSAEAPFRDEIGICLPLEQFQGITLESWIERYLADSGPWPSLKSRLRLWQKVARALHFAHTQGVVHRQLRPEVILVEDKPDGPMVRLTGFDLAKQMQAGGTVAWTTMDDERMVWAAPEVLQDFHAAEPRSDQFGLGALLALLATGREAFPDTKAFIQRGSHAPSLHDLDPRLPSTLDGVAARLLAAKPVDRYETVADAVAHLAAALRPRHARSRSAAVAEIDPEEMPPGTRLGADYEITARIGTGGLATVYLARHLASGSQRAIKVARPNEAAEAALRHEYDTLRQLHHHAVVRVVDVSNVVPGRISLIMEEIDGATLATWLDEHPQPELGLLHRYAMDLLDALGYLAARGITHKDIKPDNLLLGDKGLTLIDFSLVDARPDDIFIGTVLYRDPALESWDAAADRYAAVLCLFELYVGAHAFDGNAPEPGKRVSIDADEVEPSGLADFFRRALSPDRSERYGTLAALRDAFSRAVGRREAVVAPADEFAGLSADPDVLISESTLSKGIVTALRRAGITQQGQLVAASPEQLRRVRHIGRKRRRAVLELRDALVARGVASLDVAPKPVEAPLVPKMVGDGQPVAALGVSKGLTESLGDSGYRTVGDVAAASADDLLRIPYVGMAKITMLRRALESLAAEMEPAQTEADRAPKLEQTLEAAWVAATAHLTAREREVLEVSFGSEGRPLPAAEVAELLGVTRQDVRRHLDAAREKLDRAPLQPAADALLEGCQRHEGFLLLDEAIAALVEALPSEDDLWAAVAARVVAWWRADELAWLRGGQGLGGELFALPAIDPSALADFMAEARRLAAWPPKPPAAAGQSLATVFPAFDGDHVALAARLDADIRLTSAGELFTPPVDPAAAVRFTVRRERLPIAVDELRRGIDQRFDGEVAWPGDRTMAEFVAGLDIAEAVVEDGTLVNRAAALPETSPLAPDDLPDFLRGPSKTLEERAGQWLRGSEHVAHWRMVVTPPELHPELSRNVARAIGAEATFVSFEAAFLERIEAAGFEKFEKAEQYAAMRGALTREAEALLDKLVEEHGRAGHVVVLGDTAVLQLCKATHLIKKLYDLTLSGRRGSWVVVIPGVIHNRQPMLNESEPLFAMDGAVLPLGAPIPL